MKHIFAILMLVCTQSAWAMEIAPKSWWVGMHNPKVQIMVHKEQAAQQQWQLTPYSGVSLEAVSRLDSENYAFLTVHISAAAQPGTLRFEASNGEEFNFELQKRQRNSAERRGFDSNDVVYLINPDRFANGEQNNDDMADMLEGSDRSNRDGRHGGDIKGITQHLQYIADMGYTQIWLTPARENNMPNTSYHGYAMTDLYRIDPRMGTNQDYFSMVSKARELGVGVIMDMVPNHIGGNHPWVEDKPSADWINNNGEFIANNHRRQTVMDPNASEYDRYRFNDAWFVPSMPDLNQRVPELATYLTQNTIWWIESAGLSGIRIDTNSYSDKAFMANWSKAVMAEYPNFAMVGEEWTSNSAIIAYWQQGKNNQDGFSSGINSMMDFALQEALIKALNDKENGWTTGWMRVYESLGNDFIYANPQRLLVFADNHDMSRMYAQLEQSLAKTKLATALVLTTRGIAQMYYGSEVLLDNTPSNAHGDIRIEFPGGFEGHTANAFTGEGLKPQQAQMQNYTRQLLQLRKKHAALRVGKLTHFEPQDDIYVYFRSTEQEKIMVILNKGEQRQLSLQRFQEQLGQAEQAKNLMDSKTLSLNQQLSVPAKTATILLIE